MADILDNAQKNTDGGIVLTPPSSPSAPPPPTPPADVSGPAASNPPADAPVQSASDMPVSAAPAEPPPPVPESAVPQTDTSPEPEPHTPIAESLIVPPPESAAEPPAKPKKSQPPPPPPPPTDPSAAPKKKKGMGVILAVILLLLITLPVGVFYISQQNKPVTEERSKAASGPYPYCTEFNSQDCAFGCTPTTSGGECKPNPYVTVVPDGQSCGGNNICQTGHYCQNGVCSATATGSTTVCSSKNLCANGYTCTDSSGQPTTGSGTCKPNTNTATCGRNLDMGAPICCTGGSTCGSGQQQVCEGKRKECTDGHTWCTLQANSPDCGGGDGGDGGGNTPTPTKKSTPTPTTVQNVCTAIKVFKNNVELDAAALKALKPGDAIVITVAGVNATKAHIRVNGGAWDESTTKNANGAYTFNYTIPSDITNFTIESEVFGTDGHWH